MQASGAAHWIVRPGVAWAALGCICLLMWAAAMHPIRDPDFGWHLALGSYIALQGAVPTAEPFTHTALGNPMVAHEWLAQLTMYAVTTLTGVVGLRWLHATAVVALLLVFYRMLRRDRGPPALAVVAASDAPVVCWFFSSLSSMLAASCDTTSRSPCPSNTPATTLPS